MTTTTYKNILITSRDIEILKLLSKIKIGESDLLRDLISPDIQQNTFTKRLKKLENKGLLLSINEDQRGKTQNKLYELNTRQKKADLEAIIGGELLGGTVNMSYSIYYHTLYIGYFLRFVISEIKKKNEKYVFSVDNFVSQYEFQKRAMTRINNKRDTVIIPDGLLQIGKKIFRLEVERLNSLKEFNKKIKAYKDQYFYLNKDGFCPFFKKDDTHKLLVMTPENKMLSYKNILMNEKMKEYYSAQLIMEDKILKNL